MNETNVALNAIDGKPEINYPSKWEYRIITTNENLIKDFISSLIKKPYSLTLKNKSSKGSFVSLHLILEVENEIERNEIYKSLNSHNEIKMVI